MKVSLLPILLAVLAVSCGKNEPASIQGQSVVSAVTGNMPARESSSMAQISEIGSFGGALVSRSDGTVLGPISIHIEGDEDAAFYGTVPHLDTGEIAIKGQIRFKMKVSGPGHKEEEIPLEFENGSYNSTTGRILASFPVAGGATDQVIGDIDLRARIKGGHLVGTLRPKGFEFLGGGRFDLVRGTAASGEPTHPSPTLFRGVAEYTDGTKANIEMRIGHREVRPQEEFYSVLKSHRVISVSLLKDGVRSSSFDATIDESAGWIKGFRAFNPITQVSELSLTCHRYDGQWHCCYEVGQSLLFLADLSEVPEQADGK